MIDTLDGFRAQIREEALAEARAEHTKVLEGVTRQNDEMRRVFREKNEEAIEQLHFAKRQAEKLVGEREAVLRQMTPGDPIVYWSTHRFGSGGNMAGVDRRLFATPLGSVGQGFARPLSISETNLRESSRFPVGHGYGFRAVTVELYGSRHDVDLARRICVVAVDRLQSLHDLFPLGALAWKTESATETPNEDRLCLTGKWSAAPHGTPPHAWQKNDPLFFPSGSTFTVNLRWGFDIAEYDRSCALQNDLTVRVSLYGIGLGPETQIAADPMAFARVDTGGDSMRAGLDRLLADTIKPPNSFFPLPGHKRY